MKKFWKNFKKLLICFLILPIVVMFPMACGGDDSSSSSGAGGKINNNTYTVHFFTGSDETFNIPNQTVAKGGLVRKPDTPRRTGYVFIGWYTDMACTTVWTFEIDTVISDMTLYARWQQRSS